MLKEKLLEDLKNSMKEKNVIRKNVVQMVRAAILQIEKDKGIEVDDNKILEIIAKEVKTRNDSLEDFQKGWRAGGFGRRVKERRGETSDNRDETCGKEADQ